MDADLKRRKEALMERLKRRRQEQTKDAPAAGGAAPAARTEVAPTAAGSMSASREAAHLGAPPPAGAAAAAPRDRAVSAAAAPPSTASAAAEGPAAAAVAAAAKQRVGQMPMPPRPPLPDPTGLCRPLAIVLLRTLRASRLPPTPEERGADGADCFELVLDEYALLRKLYRWASVVLRAAPSRPVTNPRQWEAILYLHALAHDVNAALQQHARQPDYSEAHAASTADTPVGARILHRPLQALAAFPELGAGAGAVRLAWNPLPRSLGEAFDPAHAKRPRAAAPPGSGAESGATGDTGAASGGGSAAPLWQRSHRLFVTHVYPQRLIMALHALRSPGATRWTGGGTVWAEGQRPVWDVTPAQGAVPSLPGLRALKLSSGKPAPQLAGAPGGAGDGARPDGPASAAAPSSGTAAAVAAGAAAGSGAAAAAGAAGHGAARAAAPSIDQLLGASSGSDRGGEREQAELEALLQRPTARDELRLLKFRGSRRLLHFCEHGTKGSCMRARRSLHPCAQVHFRRIIMPHTDPALGDCAYLDTCRHMHSCKHVHYVIDKADAERVEREERARKSRMGKGAGGDGSGFEAQWVNCDIRTFDVSVLGKFDAIMADPPWDIHMELPYGTMSDDEMRALPLAQLQDEGVLFLWVTGRAMELGRELLQLWGYRRVEEIVWIKTNQLRRLIRTGRTGHWLNHTKEHCIVGVKGRPRLNANIDTDVLVSEIRETSRKPDEIYALIERMCPNGRYLEIFGREHNLRAGWMTLGNQLPYSNVVDPDIVRRYNARYPNAPYVPPREMEARERAERERAEEEERRRRQELEEEEAARRREEELVALPDAEEAPAPASGWGAVPVADRAAGEFARAAPWPRSAGDGSGVTDPGADGAGDAGDDEDDDEEARQFEEALVAFPDEEAEAAPLPVPAPTAESSSVSVKAAAPVTDGDFDEEDEEARRWEEAMVAFPDGEEGEG